MAVAGLADSNSLPTPTETDLEPLRLDNRSTGRLGHAYQQKLRSGKISAMFDGLYSGEVVSFFA
eukprot:CAMPEP_0194564538 /NCGR_PEP_ID=MMETSP0292-20121207/4153_1 /TAXON_ID=39354 /ORGANISM="Heterosigma akashiwo, Strain CCMP2393" /LENGTH=63 /DNA_ID=CAMNT_0039413687 /DNA_START=116 /DNA_END=307 /DNA_ORIENTATION=+